MKRSSKKRNMAISKTKNAIFEDDFIFFGELFIKKYKIIPRKREYGVFFMKIAIFGDLSAFF